MFLEINNETVVFLSILIFIVTIILLWLIFKSVRKELRRTKEEREINIEGLLSKTAMTTNISSYISKIDRDSSFSLLLLEVDKIKEISNAFGKKEAQTTLEKVILKIIQELPRRVLMSSYGQNRFLIFMKSEYDRFQCIELAKKILNILKRPVKIFRDTSVSFQGNIGISFFPAHGNKLKQLNNSLEIALHNAKKLGVDRYVIYADNIGSNLNENIEYHYEIKEAIEKKQFILLYQPIIDYQKKTLHGVEAFVRWDHPKHGILPPIQFLNIMEQSGDINWIGIWGLELIVKEYFELNRYFPNHKINFTINLSTRQILDSKMIDEFGRIVRKYKAPTSQIAFEITEFNTYLKNPYVKNNIERLNKLGFKIAVNGFGLDYTTLTSLGDIKINIIRLDKYFFEQEAETSIRNRLTDLILEYSKYNNIEVIAEGVEDEATLELMRKSGITLMQGYYFSKPMSSDDLQEYISNEKWHQSIENDSLNSN